MVQLASDGLGRGARRLGAVPALRRAPTCRGALMDRLVLTQRQRATLDAALLPPDDPDEHLVVAFAGRHSTPGGLRLVVREVVPAEGSDYLIKSPIHLEMQPVFWARVAKHAKFTGSALVIFHSHPCAPQVPTFSP